MAKFIELHEVHSDYDNGWPFLLNTDIIEIVEEGLSINGHDTTSVITRFKQYNVLEPYTEIMGILRRNDDLM